MLASADEATCITKLTKGCKPLILKANVKNPERLTLVLEHEAAAIYSEAWGALAKESSKCYMVVDVGAGSVDITVLREDEAGGINVVSLPTDNDWGGAKVNEQFSEILQKIASVSDENLEAFLEKNRLNQVKFEKQKLEFWQIESDTSTKFVIDLAEDFVNLYDKGIIMDGCSEKYPDITCEGSTLHIPYSFFEEKLVSPVAKRIMDYCLNAFNQVKSSHGIMPDTIYLVGGFGSCRYIENVLKKKVPTVPVIVPGLAVTAVVRGAVLWRQRPDVIKTRIADATYGTGVRVPFDLKYDPYYTYKDQNGKKWIDNIFGVFIQEDEIVEANKAFRSCIIEVSLPLESYGTEMKIPLHSVPLRWRWHTRCRLRWAIGY